MSEIKDNLRALIINPDWIAFCKYITENDLAAMRREIETTEFESIGELTKKQYRLRVMRELLDLPTKTLESLTDLNPMTNDPYPTNVKEIEMMDKLESTSGGED